MLKNIKSIHHFFHLFKNLIKSRNINIYQIHQLNNPFKNVKLNKTN